MNNLDYKKNIVVTGASRGIGLATGKVFTLLWTPGLWTKQAESTR
jgi:hypothetical protein